ncbi:MAG TPA: TIR domain-containing protein [Lysobacter sp.]|nr:TIR domain-containing protein [Lysobacter sp.]
MRFRAFLSYSHADAAWARWLLRRLETYRVPSRLVGTRGTYGEIGPRLGTFFRDRDELPSSGDLGATINDALVESDALIVVCSPTAARSRWVNAEVEAFRASSRGDRVLCFVIAGEPGSTDPAQRCFPPALLARAGDGNAIEPLAADARREGDGRERAFLKLVAGLLGVGYDRLAQREAQRRQRRLAWVAGLAVVGMLLMGSLTVVAMRARREAEQQRAQAEGLIEFMIGDLRKKLEPVGRLEVMDSVGEKALQYYAGQKLETLDANALGRRARALHLIGEIHDLRGQLNEAYKVFEQASLSTGQLLARAPNDQQRMFDHAQSVFWVGYIAWQRGKLSDAKGHFEQYRNLAQRLVAANPTKPEWQTELAWAHSNLGTLALDQNDVEGAIDHFERFLSITTALIKARPEDAIAQQAHTQALAWLADARERHGDWTQATGHRLAELAIYRRLLAKDPKDQHIRQSLPITEQALARLALAQGQTEAALAHLDAAAALCEQLLRTEPDNTTWKEFALKVAATRSDALLWQGQTERAASVLVQARQWQGQLTQSDANVVIWQRLGIWVQLLDARRLLMAGQGKAAESALPGLTTTLASRLQQHPDDRSLVTLQIETEALSGRLAQMQGNEAVAHAAGQRMLTLVDANDVEPHRRFLSAEGLALSGRRQEAQTSADALWRQGYRHPELAALRTRLALAP